MAVAGLGRKKINNWKTIERKTQTPLNDPFHVFSVNLNQNTGTSKYQVVVKVRNERLGKNELREIKSFASESEAKDLYSLWASHTEFGNTLNKGETLLSKVENVRDSGVLINREASSRGAGSTSTSNT